MNTAMTINTIGVMCSRKSLNVSPARLAMMMFGGVTDRGWMSPPMLEARTSAIRNGIGLIVEPFAYQQRDGRDEQDRGDVVQ